MREAAKNVACGVQAYLHGTVGCFAALRQIEQNGPGLDGIMEACQEENKKESGTRHKHASS